MAIHTIDWWTQAQDNHLHDNRRLVSLIVVPLLLGWCTVTFLFTIWELRMTVLRFRVDIDRVMKIMTPILKDRAAAAATGSGQQAALEASRNHKRLVREAGRLEKILMDTARLIHKYGSAAEDGRSNAKLFLTTWIGAMNSPGQGKGRRAGGASRRRSNKIENRKSVNFGTSASLGPPPQQRPSLALRYKVNGRNSKANLVIIPSAVFVRSTEPWLLWPYLADSTPGCDYRGEPPQWPQHS